MIPNPNSNARPQEPLIEIIAEGYQVKWIKPDPRTGLPRDPVWVPKHNLSDETIARWEAKKRADVMEVEEPRVASQKPVSRAESSRMEVDPSRAGSRSPYKQQPETILECGANGGSNSSGMCRQSGTPPSQSTPRRPPPSKTEQKTTALFIPKRRNSDAMEASPTKGGASAQPSKPRAPPLPRAVPAREPSIFLNAVGKALFEQPPVTTHWLADRHLLDTNGYLGVIAKVQRSKGRDGLPRWEDGTFEGKLCLIVQVSQDEHNRIAKVRFSAEDGKWDFSKEVPVHYLARVTPEKELDYGLIVSGKDRGLVTRMRQELGPMWYVSTMKKDRFFEVEKDALAWILPDCTLWMFPEAFEQ